MKGICVVALNWNGREVLPGMLRSLANEAPAAGARVLLFDNGSTDGSDRDAEDAFGGCAWFSIARSPVNLGFAGGANAAIAGVSEDVVVLANTDTIFLPGSLKELCEGLERHPRAAAAGPRLLWPDGSLQRSLRDFPFPGRLVREHLPLLRRASSRWDDHETERPAEWLVGAVLAMRTGVFRQAGGFDEDYFFYHEETDLQYRFHRMGREVWLVPSSRVVHIEGAAASKLYGRDTRLQYIPAKLRFLEKHGARGSRTAFRILMSALALGRMAVGILSPARAASDACYSRSYCRRVLSTLWLRRDPLKGR